MKPRTLKTYKILAVALTAAGCSSASGSEIATKPAEVQAAQPSPISMGEASRPEATTRPATPDPALFVLGAELSMKTRAEVLANTARFQPLCDKDGYPLVGNMVSKADVDKPGYRPSDFCKDLRAQADARR
jgi:hypothetical protein